MQNKNQQTSISPDSPQSPEPLVLKSSSNVALVQSTSKTSKWRYFFIVLGAVQAIGVVVFFLIMAWAIQQARSGVSGTEFIGLLVYATLVPALGLIAFINLIGLPIYLLKHKLHGKWLVLSILSILVSVVLALYGVYSVYQFRVAAQKENQLTQQLQQKFQAQQQQFAVENANPEITKDMAITLLQSCQLKGFYYTNQTDKQSGNWGQLSSTGVVLTKVGGVPYRISIADSLVSELVPIVRAAQKTCGGPQFWHDGSYEQYQNGHWYFNEQIVN